MKLRKRILFIILFLLILLVPQCGNDTEHLAPLSIISHAVSDPTNPFYINTESYKEDRESLPIGVFDSGTGGLAVLEAILTLDEFNNETNQPGSDNIPDFQSESFIYLADEANMPYGRYDAEDKAEFLKELVVKDVLFLAGIKYFISPDDVAPQTNKKPVKEIVIACNTATAYGLKTVKNSAAQWDLPLKITGIIEAGALSALETIENKNIEKPLVAVLATEGTCSSGGYPNTIYDVADDMLPGLDLQVIQQAGIGLAGAIDGDIDYIDPMTSELREGSEYFGPGPNNQEYFIDMALLDEYNFEGNNEFLVELGSAGDTIEAQLNSVRNYVRYMVTSLVHTALSKHPERSIDVVILGCTHYPYEQNEIRNHFMYLKENPKYSKIIPDSIVLTDPSKSLAVKLYTNLVKSDLLGNNSMDDSEFYISVPNTLLKDNVIDENLEFPFEWKYGRNINTGMQYVKIVPFSDRWIDPEIKERIRVNLPATYNILK